MKEIKNNKQQATLILRLSKIDDQIYCALDGHASDLTDMGLDVMNIMEMGDEIQKVIQNIVGNNHGSKA